MNNRIGGTYFDKLKECYTPEKNNNLASSIGRILTYKEEMVHQFFPNLRLNFRIKERMWQQATLTTKNKIFFYLNRFTWFKSFVPLQKFNSIDSINDEEVNQFNFFTELQI